ncbi:ABC transporter permease [Bradyrhizobium cosmicum]|uniref:ABC transporter permease protein n=1 Tax=Bradyrhizobium cosmicum TaxID=1404864 RepID=A0AAI8QFP1_9BRAD|nr:ABC transporter permease [Bradyrhizobium cosmicum]BAL79704.1 ABC transporter permease protein [Bradyrhizobium cosmicum]
MSSDQVQIAGPEISAGRASMTQPKRRLAGGLRITLTQVLILAVVLGVWEALTRMTWFEQNTIFDPFFISRPSLIGARIWQWMQPGKNAIWPHLASTLYATGLGLFVGTLSGFTVGVLLAQSRFWAKVLNPFIVSLNSMPRIAFVPLITMLFGLGLASKVVTAWFMVFFLVFFNTYKGANSVEQELVNFCRTLGGRPSQILWRVRIPTAAAWTFASLPNAISFALIGVVLAEFVGSTTGVGYLMTTSLATLNATDMFASIVILSLVGVSLVYLISAIERRLLHWSSEFRND